MTADHGEGINTTAAAISTYYPRLYHMAEANSWDSIKRHGLLSTSALLDLFEITGLQRDVIERAHRPVSIPITHPIHGTAVIRDQKPMPHEDLEKCLTDLSPEQWYELLNGQVFFWATEQRLNTLLSAREYRDRQHCVITIDTAQLVNLYSDSIRMSWINSGCTKPVPRPRGSNTFLPLARFPFDMRRKKYGLKNALAEVVIPYSVPELANLTVRVELRQGSNVLETIFRK